MWGSSSTYSSRPSSLRCRPRDRLPGERPVLGGRPRPGGRLAGCPNRHDASCLNIKNLWRVRQPANPPWKLAGWQAGVRAAVLKTSLRTAPAPLWLSCSFNRRTKPQAADKISPATPHGSCLEGWERHTIAAPPGPLHRGTSLALRGAASNLSRHEKIPRGRNLFLPLCVVRVRGFPIWRYDHEFVSTLSLDEAAQPFDSDR